MSTIASGILIAIAIILIIVVMFILYCAYRVRKAAEQKFQEITGESIQKLMCEMQQRMNKPKDE